MKKQKLEFKQAIIEQGYSIENTIENDYILNKDGLRMVVELKEGEPLVETLARLQLNYDTIKRVNKLVIKRRRLMLEAEKEKLVKWKS